VPPDNVFEDLTRILRGIDRRQDGVDGAGPDRVPALDKVDELVDDHARLADFCVVPFEGEPVSSEQQRDAEPVAERAEDAVVDRGQLGRDLVRDRQNFLQVDQV